MNSQPISPLDHLNVSVDQQSREFAFRRDSVGDNGVIRQIFQNRDYDLTRFALNAAFNSYLERIREDGRRPLIIDAGANIGASPIYFLSRYADATIVAIEPERQNCDLLRANCTGLDVRVIEAALCSGRGPWFISDPGHSDWGFRVAKRGLYEVPAVSVAQILRYYPINAYVPVIFKIDIEGGEKELFSRNVQWLKRMPIVIIELHDWLFPGKATAKNFLRAISSLDFDVVNYGENTFCFNNVLLKMPPKVKP